ncbi:hypothetical protein J31TS3_43590 [Paenibacillus lactis]|nr:hypothetical protein J31TS3_43590 [Paenibacillus lactis]
MRVSQALSLAKTGVSALMDFECVELRACESIAMIVVCTGKNAVLNRDME